MMCRNCIIVGFWCIIILYEIFEIEEWFGGFRTERYKIYVFKFWFEEIDFAAGSGTIAFDSGWAGWLDYDS